MATVNGPGWGRYEYDAAVMAEPCDDCKVGPNERCWANGSRRPKPHASRAKRAHPTVDGEEE